MLPERGDTDIVLCSGESELKLYVLLGTGIGEAVKTKLKCTLTELLLMRTQRVATKSISV